MTQDSFSVAEISVHQYKIQDQNNLIYYENQLLIPHYGVTKFKFNGSGSAGGAGSVPRSGPQYDDGSEAAHVRPAAVHHLSGPHAAGWIHVHAGPQLPWHGRTDGAEAGLPHAPHAG